MTMVKGRTDLSRRIWLSLIDVATFLSVEIVFFFAYTFYANDFHGFSQKPFGWKEYGATLLLLLAITMLCRFALRIYSYIWRYSDASVYLKMAIADVAALFITLIVLALTKTKLQLPHVIVVSLSNVLLTLGGRFFYAFLHKRGNFVDAADVHKIPVAIVGAGQLGLSLAEDLQKNARANYKPLFFIDRDPQKVGMILSGLRVYPDNEATLEFIKNHAISEIFIAVADLSNELAERLFRFYSGTGCKIKIYDTPVKDFDGTEDVSSTKKTLREFQIEDLLFRKQIKLNDPEALANYTGKTVLVTGGGGSIGSEICRQIAACCPKKLIIFDIYENNAYDIQQELTRKYGDLLDLSVEIGSVRDRARLDAVFCEYRPDIVFHAAAHKHVPLMEHSGCEAIKNNVLGTYNTADMAEKYGVRKFILISTDKAVNPTNIMGASKRLCEMVVQCRTDSATSFAAVRFGNVLGSNGSVIPLFKRQIASGGPITLTDKRIIRYFMTIPEASQLVLRAGAMAKRGELFVLDMGKPVRIYDLAVNMIKLSGLEPEKDIKIEEIGLRPGEKLYEELLIKTEELDKTDNAMIFVERDTPLSREEVEAKLDLLRAAVEDAKEEIASPKIKEAIRATVPTFHDPEEVNRTAEESDEFKVLTTK